MTKNNIIFFVCCCVALFLAIQAWVWLRFAGALWVSDSLHLMDALLKSISPIKIGLQGFFVFVAPVVAATFAFSNRISTRLFVSLSIFLGTLASLLYLLVLAKTNLIFLKQQFGVYVAAGSITGLIYGTILQAPWLTGQSSDKGLTDIHSRRKLLGSLGLLAGAASLTGSFFGPFYFWKNRNKYVDVKIGALKEGQMIVVKVANRPVWILKRTLDQISRLKLDSQLLLDPNSSNSRQPEAAKNSLRSIRPKFFVVEGICTHLGCSPRYEPSDYEEYSIPEPQFFCPCHGGSFDLAGRVYRGTPPPENMVVPKHEFVSEDVIRVYYPSLSEEWSA